MSDNLIAIAVYQQASSGEHDLEHDGKRWQLVESDDQTDALAEEFIKSVGEDKINEPMHFASEKYLFVIERVDDEQRDEMQGD
jgi:hypothetical protein